MSLLLFVRSMLPAELVTRHSPSPFMCTTDTCSGHYVQRQKTLLDKSLPLILCRCIESIRTKRNMFRAVASLGLVSPGAATDGVTLIFSWKKLTTFLSYRRLQSDDFFSCPTSFVHCSLSHIFFISIGCHPMEAVRVSPEAVRSSPVPLSDATGSGEYTGADVRWRMSYLPLSSRYGVLGVHASVPMHSAHCLQPIQVYWCYLSARDTGVSGLDDAKQLTKPGPPRSALHARNIMRYLATTDTLSHPRLSVFCLREIDITNANVN